MEQHFYAHTQANINPSAVKVHILNRQKKKKSYLLENSVSGNGKCPNRV